MRRKSLACDACPVRDRAVCAALDQHERRELARLGHHRTVSRGETLFAAGDDNAVCATLITGALKVSSFDERGTEHIVSLIHPAGVAGELFAPAAHHDVIALTDSELCVFPRGEYERALKQFPDLGVALLHRSSQELLESRSLLALTNGRTARERVAGVLLTLARAATDAECHSAQDFDLVLSRGEIVSLLGTTIETVSRQFTRLERERLIRRHGARGIQLLDAARLRKLAD